MRKKTVASTENKHVLRFKSIESYDQLDYSLKKAVIA